MIDHPLTERSPDGALRAALPAILAILILALPAPSPAGDAEGPPPTRREEVREIVHGVEIVDPYRWLEAQDSPETHAWIAAQNAYTQSRLAKLPHRPAIRQRLAELIRVDRVDVPIPRP